MTADRFNNDRTVAGDELTDLLSGLQADQSAQDADRIPSPDDDRTLPDDEAPNVGDERGRHRTADDFNDDLTVADPQALALSGNDTPADVGAAGTPRPSPPETLPPPPPPPSSPSPSSPERAPDQAGADHGRAGAGTAAGSPGSRAFAPRGGQSDGTPAVGSGRGLQARSRPPVSHGAVWASPPAAQPSGRAPQAGSDALPPPPGAPPAPSETAPSAGAATAAVGAAAGMSTPPGGSPSAGAGAAPAAPAAAAPAAPSSAAPWTPTRPASTPLESEESTSGFPVWLIPGLVAVVIVAVVLAVVL